MSHTEETQGGDNKCIFLIRHAESVNNLAKREARAAWRGLKRLQSLPTGEQWGHIASLCSFPMDTDLSGDGEDMVHRLRGVLEESNFLAAHNIDLIVHSPLIRARRTCHGLFREPLRPADSDGVVAGGQEASGRGLAQGDVPIVEHDGIFERDISEHVHIADMHVRVQAFIDWLVQRPERNIVVVGHSAFFRGLIGTRTGMDNCEVKKVVLSCSDGTFHSTETLVPGGKSLLTPR